MAKAGKYEGGCLCGNIRFVAIGAALKPHTCSCRQCQRHTGALTTAWVEFPRDQIEWTGPGGEPSKWRSSDYSSRSFCARCGSTIGAIDDEPIIAIVIGAFDSPNRQALKPLSHSYKSKTPKWWDILVT